MKEGILILIKLVSSEGIGNSDIEMGAGLTLLKFMRLTWGYNGWFERYRYLTLF